MNLNWKGDQCFVTGRFFTWEYKTQLTLSKCNLNIANSYNHAIFTVSNKPQESTIYYTQIWIESFTLHPPMHYSNQHILPKTLSLILEQEYSFYTLSESYGLYHLNNTKDKK